MSAATEWRVVVRGKDIGSVMEDTEANARYAALSKFGDESERAVVEALDGHARAHVIYADDEFDVRRA